MTTQTISPQAWELEWTFGDRIRKVRRTLGLTAAEMGEVLEMTAQGVSNLEARPGTPRASRAMAARLELAHGVPSWWLLGYDKPPTDGPGVSGSYTTRDSNPEPIELETVVGLSPFPLGRARSERRAA